MLIESRLDQVDERGAVDVDVVETRRHRLVDEVPDGFGLSLGVSGEFLGRCLEVIALDEKGSPEALPDGAGQHGRNVFGGTLVGVADLRAGDLEDDGAGVELARGPEDGPGRVVAQHAQVYGRDGKDLADFASSAGHVKVVDRGRPDAQGLSGFPDQPAGSGLSFGITEDGVPAERIHPLGKPLLVFDENAGILGFEDSLV